MKSFHLQIKHVINSDIYRSFDAGSQLNEVILPTINLSTIFVARIMKCVKIVSQSDRLISEFKGGLELMQVMGSSPVC